MEKRNLSLSLLDKEPRGAKGTHALTDIRLLKYIAIIIAKEYRYYYMLSDGIEEDCSSESER